ncbi:hypothetical protein EIP91_000396 [Steccherinum ochraceum]|uniref:Uncharacterized protein n=1 Tax=Steccherinum ochraceum TaxID=92696 RepID=A0A4R0RFR1_9APHY|nr:hypothetical protein EIP91_000396 [Steccherinum ochraceum]
MAQQQETLATSVFDKLHELKDALQPHTPATNATVEHTAIPAGERKTQEEVRAEIRGEAKAEEHIQRNEGWSERIKDVLDGGEAHRAREAEADRARQEKEHEEAKEKVEAERGWTGKVQDVFDGGKHKQELEEAVFARLEAEAVKEKKAHEGLGEKLRDALEDKVHADQSHLQHLWEDAPAKEKVEQEGHRKVWDREGREPAGGKKNDEGWRDQLRALARGGQKEEKKQVERSWLKEKLNNMTGGGAAGEANEDKLDKTIDFVQEHILHQGDQSDESALENWKDEQISDTIRMAYKQVSGHELPIADNIQHYNRYTLDHTSMSMSQEAPAQNIDRPEESSSSSSSNSGLFGALSKQMNEMGGGGKAGEAKEDKLDKGIDWVQEHVLGQGPQTNESASEQFKDEQMSDFIRGQYKGAVGSEFPLADK